jgi:hypothetical protein
VLVQQVDAVGAQALQRGLDHSTDALWAAVHARTDEAVLEAELGRDHHLVAHRGQGLAHHLLVQPTVGFGSVEEGHAALDGLADELHARRPVQAGAVAVTQAHAAETEGRDFEAAAAELTLFHRVLLAAAFSGLPSR